MSVRDSGGTRVLILPAIDIRGGQCVRLRQGDYAQETVFGADPAAMARRWVDQGAPFLHLVDLDGAREGQPINGDSIRGIVQSAGVPCQLGGGLRNEQHITEVLGWSITRVVLGTRALQDPDWCEAMSRRFPGQIVLGVDARRGKVATHGWLEDGELTAIEAARRCAGWPLAALVYTDIGRDGMLQGPDVEGTCSLQRFVSYPVIASGGVSSLDDVAGLARAGVAGCIIGRALYDERFTLADALGVARKGTPLPSVRGGRE
jgi:phosphoribosylformimino-5-aminoimidazole carboxamide ribotide isomerase